MTAQPQYTTPVAFALEHLYIDPMSPSGFSWKTSGTGRRADLRAGRRDTHGYWQVWPALSWSHATASYGRWSTALSRLVCW